MDSNTILEISKQLMQKIENMDKERNNTSIIKLKKEIFECNDKYKELHDKHFPIFHGILTKKVTKDNVFILKKMLKEKTKIDENRIKLADATQNISGLLSNHFDVDWEKI